MKKYGPSKGELQFRLVVSILGLGVIAGIIITRGIPSGPALFEVIGVAGVFFLGTFIFALRGLLRRD